MKSKLNQLTVDQFIELLQGNTSVLQQKGEVVSPKILRKAVRDIVMEYKIISDPSGTRAFIAECERLQKARISLALYTICRTLISIGEIERVRATLKDAGIRVNRMNETRLIAEINSRIARSKDTIARIEKSQTPQSDDLPDIRMAFDSLAASLMTYFKFQIDTSVMKASIFAHLIEKHRSELKAKLNAISRN